MRWWQIRKRDEDLERELRTDLELEEEEQRERGLPPEKALYAARRAFGNPTLIKEQTHEAWGWVPLERLWQDVRYGLRQLIRNPGFTIVAVMTLALGIGVNTTIFSAVSAILLRKPPVKDPDTLCAISSRILHGYDLARASAPDFESWQKQNDVFEQMTAVETGRSFTLTGKFRPESVEGERVTPDFFSVIGIMPALGRPFLPSESQPGRNHEVILSASLWHEHFAGDPRALGQDLEIDEEAYRIVGVMPPFAGVSPESDPQLWTPLVFNPEDLSPAARANHYINLVLGRLKPGLTVQQAQAEMDSVARQLAQRHPATNKNWGVTVLRLQEYNVRSEDVRNAMMLIMSAVGLVLLIACANVAGLLLARGACRSHEFAVRSALGASRVRILRQMLTESLLIGVSSSVAGLLISLCGIRLLRAGFDFNRYGQRIAAGLRIDAPTLLFMLGITLLTTILFGLLPSIRFSKTPPRAALNQTDRTASAAKGSSQLRRLFVVAEVATAVILLTAAGVVMRQLLRELNEPNGFNPQHLLIARLDVSSPRYKLQNARIAFYEQVMQRIRNLPGVEGAAMDSCVPMSCFFSLPFDFVGRAAQPSSARPSANFFVVGPEYFRTMQIPLLKGRGFSDDDNVQQPVVAVVNQEFARRFFPNENVIGKQIEVKDGNHKRTQIIGVVGNVNNVAGQTHPRPQIYECYLQIPVKAFSNMALVVRARIPTAGLAPMLRRAVWSVDNAQAIEIRTMGDLVNDNIGGDRLVTGLMGLFAGFALGLAGLGIYGVIAYSVAQRTREIGIRLAFGATKRDVLGMVLRESGVLIGIGCTFGTLAGLLLPKLIRGILSGFAPQGPLAVLAAAAIVIVVSWLATCIPAYRAMNVDPVGALRSE
ncbi:MAG: ABC transporter permease [Acidobacteriaceae bacterium]